MRLVCRVERLGNLNYFGARGTNLPAVLLHYKTDKAYGATVSKEGVQDSGGEAPTGRGRC